MHYVHRYKIQTIEKIVGLFVLFSLLLVIFISLFVAKKKGAFEKDYRLITLFNEGYGLTPGTVVKLAGIEVGTVETVDFNPENKVEVVMKVRKKFQQKIRMSSVVSISREGLAGEKFLNISLGSLDSPIAENQDRIQARVTMEISDLADKITPTIEYIEKISSNLVQITDKLVSPGGELSVVLTNIQELTTDLKEGKGSIGYLLRDDRKLYKDIEKLMKASQRISGNLETTTENLKNMSTEAPKTMSKINDTIDETKKLVQDARTVIDAAKKHWLIRGYVEESGKKEEKPKEEKPKEEKKIEKK